MINGWMEGKYTGIRYVHAKGEIQAKVWHTKSKKIPYNVTERKETGRLIQDCFFFPKQFVLLLFTGRMVKSG